MQGNPRLGLAGFLATFGGSGRFPVASGTAGSLAALPFGVGLQFLGFPLHLAAVILLSLIGIWAAGVHAQRLGRKDPGEVVVDEAAGLWLALLFVPPDWSWVMASFLLFRVFDIWKPWPLAAWERLPGGLGIMMDDLGAGLYTGLVLTLIAKVVAA